LAACRIGAALGIPVVLTEHSSALMGGVAGDDLEDLQEVLAGATVLSAVGSSLAHRLEEMRPATVAKPCTVLGNLLDPVMERASAQVVGSKDRGRVRPGFRLLAIGGLIPVKNHSLLLQAFARTFGQDPSVQLRIGGSGPLDGRLREEACRLGVAARVVFLGHLDRARVAEELAACDAVVSTSQLETFGVVLIEAMAFGKPVVATRCGGPQDFVGEGQGILADLDIGSVASALQVIRGASFDPQAIRAHCLGWFGAEAFFHRLMALYAPALVVNPGIKD
jgi:glycosyltransferase involved in cell wall biosynthesis